MKRTTFKHLAALPSTNLPLFLAEMLKAFAEEMMIDQDDPLLVRLVSVSNIEEFNALQWKEMTIALTKRGLLPVDTVELFMQHLVLLAYHAKLQACLSSSASSTTLKQKNAFSLPSPLPEVLHKAEDELRQMIRDLDAPLHYGRMLLQQFQHLLFMDAELFTLDNVLRQVEGFSIQYMQTHDRAKEAHEQIVWYLQQTQGPVASDDASHAA